MARNKYNLGQQNRLEMLVERIALLVGVRLAETVHRIESIRR